jgi:hypothetical protein
MRRPLRVVTRTFRTALDPTVAIALWGVGVAAVVAGATEWAIDGWPPNDVLPVFGGIIVLLGSYFAARTLSETERDRATQMLASEQPAVRVAGIYRLGEVATYHPRHREYVESALLAYSPPSDSDDRYAHGLASALLAELRTAEQAGGDGDTLFRSLIDELHARKPQNGSEPGSQRAKPDETAEPPRSG